MATPNTTADITSVNYLADRGFCLECQATTNGRCDLFEPDIPDNVCLSFLPRAET
jgi:hypothetical protein